MVVNDKKFVYASESLALTKKLEYKTWFQSVDSYVTIRTYPEIVKGSYSETEVNKLLRYMQIANDIVTDVMANLDQQSQDGFVGIEGYSYSSAAGPLIDLVTLSTLIRLNIFFSFGVLVEHRVFQPTEVKAFAAKLTYPAIPKNKAGTKVEYRNNEGIAGGSFKKPEIYKALLENPALVGDPWVEYLRDNADEALSLKNVPKPIEDVNDAKILYEIIKNNVHR